MSVASPGSLPRTPPLPWGKYLAHSHFDELQPAHRSSRSESGPSEEDPSQVKQYSTYLYIFGKKKHSNQKAKVTFLQYFLILSNFYGCPPRNVLKYPKIAIFDKGKRDFCLKRPCNLLFGANLNARVFAHIKKEFEKSFLIWCTHDLTRVNPLFLLNEAKEIEPSFRDIC